MCTIAKNEKWNSYELTFDGKPSEQVRELLKANGYRWNKTRGIWYGFADISTQLNGNTGTDETSEKTAILQAEQNADKEEQARIRAEFLAEIERIEHGNKKWVEYHDKETARCVRFENGMIYAIEKPRIETRFCFGYGYCGISTDEDEERAYNMAKYARENGDYFLEQNLEKFDKTIKDLEENGDFVYVAPMRDNTEKWVYIRVYRGWWDFENEFKNVREKMFKLSPSDVENLKKAYEIERKAFEKRLNSYLKKYGTSKLKVWTYLSD